MYHIDPPLYIPIGVCVLMLIGILYTIREERRNWNDGVCQKSGKPWRQFTTTSQGSRGYTDDHGNYCWVSYDCVDKRKKKS